MYKKVKNRQIELTDFNQPMGFKLNPENRWVKKADTIPWNDIEDKYAALFPSKTGMPAKPLRMALGSLLIQKEYGYSDRELLEQIKENPYYQFFIGLPGFQYNAPFVPSLLVEFRKRLTDDILIEINEMILNFNNDNDPDPDGDRPVKSDSETDDSYDKGSCTENQGTLILDATCAPQNIKYPQDINLLNEVREKLESMIDTICYDFNYYKPRMYRQKARKDYLNLAKSKKRKAKAIRSAIRKQLQYIRRDRAYVEDFASYDDVWLTEKQKALLTVIDKVYEQQKYMYENNTHTVKDRIVSISQPYVRPIVRGKAAAPVEFGAKLDMSIDEKGFARLETLSFDPYNENEILIPAIERYLERTGHYPERVLVDKIYRNRQNITFCKEHGIRISGPRLGRPRIKPDAQERKMEYRDNADRVGVERGFALCKHSYGLGLIVTKLEDTTRSSIALSILAMNLGRIAKASFCPIFEILLFYETAACTSKIFGADFCTKWQNEDLAA